MEEEVKQKETPKEEEKAPEKPLDKMTATELREIARGIEGLTGVHAMKKDDLLKAVKEARGVEEEPEKKEKKEVKAGVGVHVLKKKIVGLKKEKEDARNAKDKKKLRIYRRRINRLKKRTRKAAQA
jgi:hypothetical protein